MALSKLHYTRQDLTLDDGTTALLVVKSMLYMIKALLKGEKVGTTGTSGAPPAGALWTVYYSCDSVTAGTANDGVDRWGGGTFDATKIVRGTASAIRSWMVLKSPAALTSLGVPFYLILSFDGSTDAIFNVLLSKTAPTGGTTIARPTSTDEVTFSTAWTISDVTTGTHRSGIVVDANGNFWISFRKSAVGNAHTILAVSALSDTIAGDLFPVVLLGDTLVTGRGAGTAGDAFMQGTGYQTAGVQGGCVSRSPLNGAGPLTANGCGLLYISNTNFYTATVTNQANSLADVLPATYYHVSTGILCLRGSIPDWWVGNITKSVGSVEPATGSSEHVNIGNLWLPNGGVAPTF